MEQKALFSGRTYSTFDRNAEAVLLAGDAAQSLAELPDGTAKLIITSPPYNLGKVYEKATVLDDYLKALEPVIGQLIRVLAPDGSLCWQVGNYVANSEVFPLDIFYYPVFKSRGLKLRNRIVWHFEHGLHASKRFSGRYEVLLWFTKGDEYTFNLDDVRVPSKYPGKTYFFQGQEIRPAIGKSARQESIRFLEADTARMGTGLMGDSQRQGKSP